MSSCARRASGPVHLGLIMPSMTFIGNLSYVAIAVVGGVRVANGSMSLGDVQAFIQYSRQFTMPLTQVASMANFFNQVSRRRSVYSKLLDAEEERADPASRRCPPIATDPSRVRDVSFRYSRISLSLDDLSLVASPGYDRDRWSDGAGKTTLVNLIMRSTRLDAGRITLDGALTSNHAPGRPALTDRHGAARHLALWGDHSDNIAYGNLNATEQQIRAAAESNLRRSVRGAACRSLRHGHRR